MLAIFLIILGVMTRVVTHIPNFTPVLAIALFGGFYLPKRVAIVLPITLMAITDVVIGFHETMLFTWGTLILVSVLGVMLRDKKNFVTVGVSSVAAAVFFFLVTNLGVWAVSGMYAHTWDGLAKCFTLAIPFFRSTLWSTLIYSAVLFSAYEGLALYIRRTRLAQVLL